MTNSILQLDKKYGVHFENLSKEDRATVAGVILLWISLAKDSKEEAFLSQDTITVTLSRYVLDFSDEAHECLEDIREAHLDKSRLLDICSALLAGCR